MEFGPVTPMLKVTSLPVSLAFFTGALGFAHRWSWSHAHGFDKPDAATDACIEQGEATVFLSTEGGSTLASLFIELEFAERVEALAEQLRGRVPFEGPSDRPWGSRELTLRDPDGHTWRFSCPTARVAQG